MIGLVRGEALVRTYCSEKEFLNAHLEYNLYVTVPQVGHPAGPKSLLLIERIEKNAGNVPGTQFGSKYSNISQNSIFHRRLQHHRKHNKTAENTTTFFKKATFYKTPHRNKNQYSIPENVALGLQHCMLCNVVVFSEMLKYFL